MNALASNLRSKDHLTVFGRLFAARMDALPVVNTLVYCMETVPETALDALADQFHVTGYEGWKFCTTVDEKRELLKNSIKLHAKKGTPWSIKKACEIAGFPGVYFQEGVGIVYDGTYVYDGSETHGSEGWAKFIAFVPVPNPALVPPTVGPKLINEYKPVRCELISVEFVTR